MSTTSLLSLALGFGCLLAVHASASTLPPGDDSIPEPSGAQAEASAQQPAWAGTYRGTFPAADCPGIQTVLTLTDKGEYQLTSTYLANEPKTFTASGKITWIELGKRFEILTNDYGEKFEIEGDRIYKLTAKGERVTGPLAAHYVLTRDK